MIVYPDHVSALIDHLAERPDEWQEFAQRMVSMPSDFGRLRWMLMRLSAESWQVARERIANLLDLYEIQWPRLYASGYQWLSDVEEDRIRYLGACMILHQQDEGQYYA